MRHGLEVGGLVALVGGRAVLREVTCVVPVGRVFGVLGPPGSGKSTLLRCVVGAQEVGAGEVRVLGMRAGAPELRRRVGYAPGARSIYLDLTAGQNVRYFAAVWGISRAAADRVLAEVEMSDVASERAGSLPVDLQARLSLACALVAAPEMLVADELTAGLDPVARGDLWGRYGALAARGRTVVVASQVLDDALLCDRVLLLCDGRLVGEGTPEDLLGRTDATNMEQAFVRLRGRHGVGARPSRPAAARVPVEVAR